MVCGWQTLKSFRLADPAVASLRGDGQSVGNRRPFQFLQAITAKPLQSVGALIAQVTNYFQPSTHPPSIKPIDTSGPLRFRPTRNIPIPQDTHGPSDLRRQIPGRERSQTAAGRRRRRRNGKSTRHVGRCKCQSTSRRVA